MREIPTSPASLRYAEQASYCGSARRSLVRAAGLEPALKILDAMPARMRQRFLLGEFASETDSPLWTVELLDQRRILDGRLVDFQRIVISVDPSGAAGPEDMQSLPYWPVGLTAQKL